MRKSKNISEFVGQYKIVRSDCMAIDFYAPDGSNGFTVNSVSVPAGANYSISAADGFIDVTQYNINFAVDGDVGNQCIVTRTIEVN